MKKPATYGSIDETIAETCSCNYFSSTETSPDSSSDDLLISTTATTNHKANVIMVDFMSFSRKRNICNDCHLKYQSLLFMIILLAMAISFLALKWWHPCWKWPFEASQIVPQDLVDEYDYIIVGAGPAGLLVAFHLAKRLQEESIEAHGDDIHAGKVLVLESGTESQSDVMKVLLMQQDDGRVQQEEELWNDGAKNMFDIPLLWSELSSKDDWSEYLSHHWPVEQTFLGRAVGGSGIHNAMINVRALPNDFQKWNITNWSAEEMMPYFNKLENYHETIPIANYSPPLPKPNSRGSNGPLNTIVGGDMAVSPICAYFIASAVAAGFPLATLGFNDAEAVNRIGVGFYEFNIRNGIRDSVAKALLGSSSSSSQQEDGTSTTIPTNLYIQTNATVHNILFQSDSTTAAATATATRKSVLSAPRATGVQYYSNQNGSFRQVRLRSYSQSKSHPIPTIQRDPEIILSAGAILSSQILANSGISKGGYLVDSPNVGNNLQDHPVVAIEYRVIGDLSESIVSFFQNADTSASLPLSFETNLQSFPSNTTNIASSVYGTAGFSVGGFLASPCSKDHVPDIQITVFPHTKEPHYSNNNNNNNNDNNHNNALQSSNYTTTGTNILITVALLQPESRNQIVVANTITSTSTSSTNKSSSSFLGHFPLPQIQGGNLTDGDASRLAWGVNQVRKIMSTPPLRDSIAQLNEQQLPPLDEDMYSNTAKQDQDLKQYIKDHVMRNAHWSGSTRMGNDDDDDDDLGSVVNSRLQVRGVDSLRIVDAGVMPFIPNGNTHSTTCVIALRAVDLILNKD
eukprot:CAMPEP_0176482444 /NCGR_PEP_ID=MMETSP0200_2-20121128/3378_1 /TAXON_ID=947934 /ORGANISM="Chaetoceros sp., Strain GSL56" /LENGTH=798 /DNA_ID=CAMNT_0017878759 /DNA_START=37 /DNA_END=2430 /DNA_ORIENTATION=-